MFPYKASQTKSGNMQSFDKQCFPLCKHKQRKMRNRPLVTDKTQPQRCQERAGLKDNTTHTPYMEFLTFFLIHNTPNEVCKQAKIEKIEKNSFVQRFCRCESIVRGPVWRPPATSKLKTEKIPSNNFYLPFLAPCDPTRRECQNQKRRILQSERLI